MPRDHTGRLVRYHLYVDDGENGHLVAEGAPLPPEGRQAPRWRSTTILVEVEPNAPEETMRQATEAALAEWRRIQAEKKRRRW